MLYNNTTLIAQIDQYIADGCSTWNDLDEIDKDLVVAEAIRVLGDEAYVCITESDELGEILKALRGHLNTGNNMYDLAQTMTHAVTQYFTPELSKLFAERKAAYDEDMYYENGYVPVIDKQTGEQQWVRA